jgi:hypothetical protein
MQFFTLYNILIMPGLHFLGQKLSRLYIVKMAHLTVLDYLSVTLDSPRIYVGAPARPSFDAVFHALQLPYHARPSSSYFNNPHVEYHRMTYPWCPVYFWSPSTNDERVIQPALDAVINALQSPYHD